MQMQTFDVPRVVKRRALAVVGILATTVLAGGWSASAASAAPTLRAAQTFHHQTPSVAGDVELVTTVRNAGADATSGEFRVDYQLPAGLSPVSITGNGWSCDLPTLRCTRTAALSGGDAAPEITVIADVQEGAPERVSNRVTVSGGGSAAAESTMTLPTEPTFEPTDLSTRVEDEAGDEYTQAGGHPFSANATFSLATRRTKLGVIDVTENMKDAITELPPGFVGNPKAAAECEFVGNMRLGLCPLDSTVGYVRVAFGGPPLSGVPPIDGVTSKVGVYRLKAGRGHAATFGFEVQGTAVLLNASVRSDSDFGLTITAVGTPQLPNVGGVSLTFCGQGTHVERGVYPPSTMTFECVDSSSEYAYPIPFLSNPVDCTVPAPTTKLTVNSWQQPSRWKSIDYESPQLTGCDALVFEPTAELRPDVTTPDSPTGLAVDLHVPQNDDGAGLATPPLKRAKVTLPEGMTINPAGANGLEACADANLKLKSKDPVSCPDASKVGTATASSPLLDETLTGGIYIRSQNSDDPESGEMFRIALILENEERGSRSGFQARSGRTRTRGGSRRSSTTTPSSRPTTST